MASECLTYFLGANQPPSNLPFIQWNKGWKVSATALFLPTNPQTPQHPFREKNKQLDKTSIWTARQYSLALYLNIVKFNLLNISMSFAKLWLWIVASKQQQITQRIMWWCLPQCTKQGRAKIYFTVVCFTLFRCPQTCCRVQLQSVYEDKQKVKKKKIS